MRELEASGLETVCADYDRDGYAYVRNLFTADELAPLVDGLDHGGASPGGFAVTDSAGGKQELSVWMHLGEDLVGVIPRLEPMAAIASAVVGEPVGHWHSKLSWKRPGTDSRWDWHQDYGFWADEGVPRSDMCTIAVALGPITEENGCMQLVAGSHHLGRIGIEPVGGTVASDPARVRAALEDHRVEKCELAVGDVVVFHSNTLHSSGPNHSPIPRTMLMSSYTAVSNQPSEPARGRDCAALDVVPAAALAGSRSVAFGSSPFIDPTAADMSQGYSITKVL